MVTNGLKWQRSSVSPFYNNCAEVATTFSMPNPTEQLSVISTAELRSWLADNHARQDSIWLVTYEKFNPDNYLSTSEVLDELLAYGWIDGYAGAAD